MNQRIWHKGPPPHIGWWNASIDHKTDRWRWWNGSHWSLSATSSYNAKTAAAFARVQSEIITRIEWTDYWPENARVPRIKP
jgi:hypothetical protein